jgi:TRAP-type C4-dicarboxylate transport system substrate-binding protein
VGFIYIFTNASVHSAGDLRHVKMWMWEGDPIAEAAFKAMNVNPISLSITDVLTSLQTKLVDGVYTSPLAAIALQWFTRVKYALNVPLADASGAVVVSKKRFDELPPELREILTRNGKTFMRKLTKLSREDNAKSMDIIKKSGVTLVEASSPQEVKEYDEIGRKARLLLAGKLFSEDLLKRVEAKLAEYRAAHPSGAK